MAKLTTPIAIIESYFDVELGRVALSGFNQAADDRWRDFARHHLARTMSNVATDFPQATAVICGATPAICGKVFQPQ